MSIFEPTLSSAEGPCLACGLCCNAVIFADVRLQPGDDAEKLTRLGLPLAGFRGSRLDAGQNRTEADSLGSGARFRQPCAALDGCECRIYANRPQHCRNFECLLFKAVRYGGFPAPAALSLIQQAKRRAQKALRLLRKLGDTDEHLALASRFRRTRKRLEQTDVDAAAARAYGELTLAVHDLNAILQDSFYV